MSMRLQPSLMFDDENLFDNFITPYKNEKLLNSLIIRCLSAYYYNEEVRNLIEGTTIEDTASEEVASNQELINNIRASLLMQDFFASELQNTIDNGTQDISDILNNAYMLENNSGVIELAHTEYGSELLRIDSKELKSGQFMRDDKLNQLLGKVSSLVDALEVSSKQVESPCQTSSGVVTSEQDYPNKHLHDVRKHISPTATACTVSSEKLQEMNEADEEMLNKSREALLSIADLQLCVKELSTALDDFNKSLVKKITSTNELIDESDQMEEI